MRTFSGVLKLLVVLVTLTFALKNTEAVTVRYYLGTQWQAPLILVVLAAFAAGAVTGVMASLTRMARLRHELAVIRRKVTTVDAPMTSAAPVRVVDAR
jgi:uncharacterized integral membrane protein